MKYQVKYRKDVEFIETSALSDFRLAEHFSRNGYDNLYISVEERLSYIVTFDDYMEGAINQSLERPFIIQNTDLSHLEIPQLFRDNPDINRFVVLNNDTFVCEIDSMVELPIQNGLAKNLMALRYVDLFHDDLESFWGKRKVFLISDTGIRDYLSSRFPLVQFDSSDDIDYLLHLDMENEYDIVIDLLLCSNIRSKLGLKISNFVNLSQVIMQIAIRELHSFCYEKDVGIIFYKVPQFPEFTCLNDAEYYNGANRNRLGKILKDKAFIEKYISSEEERYILENRVYHEPRRLDNGYCFVQDVCDNEYIHVENGIRRSYPDQDYETDVPTVNFYGPCATFGFLVPDKTTIPSIIKQFFIENDKTINISNRAGAHGFNELNAIMEALNTPIKKGDYLVFLDTMYDLDLDDYPNAKTTVGWFNSEKKKEDVWFLDFPGHWGLRANNLIAKHIFDDIYDKFDDNSFYNTNDTRSTYLGDKYNYFENMKSTHPACVKFFFKYHKFFFPAGSHIGAVVFDDEYDDGYSISVIENALEKCDALYVFSFNIDISEIDENSILNSQMELRVKGKPVHFFLLDGFFRSSRYLKNHRGSVSRMNEFEFTERALTKAILGELDVATRFVTSDTEPKCLEIITSVANEERMEVEVV